jgi:mono/diheme cytochrome c family protein
MQLFPNLSDKDIDDILAYTTNPPAPEEKKLKQTATDVLRQLLQTKLLQTLSLFLF